MPSNPMTPDPIQPETAPPDWIADMRELEQIYNLDEVASQHARQIERIFDKWLHDEHRSPDGDGQSLVGRTGERAAAAAVDLKQPHNADYGTMRPKVQSDQQTADVSMDAAGKPQTVSAGGRVTEQYEPQLRRPRPQVAGSTPADAHTTLEGETASPAVARYQDRLEALADRVSAMRWPSDAEYTDLADEIAEVLREVADYAEAKDAEIAQLLAQHHAEAIHADVRRLLTRLDPESSQARSETALVEFLRQGGDRINHGAIGPVAVAFTPLPKP